MQEKLLLMSARKIASKASLLIALLLVVAKLGGWFITGSVALLSSAVDAIVDVAASLVTFIGVRYAEQPPDEEHRFGHGKGEAIAAFTQAMFLAGAAVVLAIQSINRLLFPVPLSSLDVGIWVIVGSMVAAVILVALQSWALKKDPSTAIAADKAHYVTDIALNAAVLAALGVTQLTGWERADPIFALIISSYMLWNSRHIAHQALLQLLDRELSDEQRQQIKDTVLACDGVRNIHDLRTRHAGDRFFVEFHLEVDGSLSVDRGHTICDNAEAAIAKILPGKVEVTCHLEPYGIDDDRLDNRVKLTVGKK